MRPWASLVTTRNARVWKPHQTLIHSNRVEFLSFLNDYEDLLGHFRVSENFASPCTREGFGISFAEAMAADCTVIAADHPDSAADEEIGEAGLLVEPTVDGLATTF